MTPSERFDPFNDRLCRNVRNALSESFRAVLGEGDMHPVQRIAGFFLDDAPPDFIDTYIRKRLAAYQHVLAEVGERRLADPLEITVVLWDQGLFFETHEYLEAFWMEADGEEKKLLQAIIRAAGAYVHIEQGNLIGARRIADKALDVLKRQQDRLGVFFDPGLLLDKLKTLDPIPPKLYGTTR